MYSKRLSVRQTARKKELKKKLRKQQIKTFARLSLLLVLIAIFIYIILLFVQIKNRGNTQTTFLSVTPSQPPANEGPTPIPISEVGLDSTIDKSSFKSCLESTTKIIKEFFYRTYSDNPSSSHHKIQDSLNEYAFLLLPFVKEHIQAIDNEMTNSLAIIVEDKYDDILLTYFKVLFKFSLIIDNTFKIYHNITLITFHNKSIGDEEQYISLKFVIQQLVFKQQIVILYEILGYFKDLLNNLEFRNTNTNGLLRAGEQIIGLFEPLKNKMFLRYDKSITINGSLKNIKLRYIINDLENCRKFSILNFYLVYLSLFCVNDDLKVTAIDDKAIEQINKLLESSTKNNNKVKTHDWVKKVLANCGNVLKRLDYLKIEKVEEYYHKIYSENFKCMDQIYKLALVI